MATSYVCKILLAIPIARVAALRTWVANNIDVANGQSWFALKLSASGTAPATYNAACFHATQAELLKWIQLFLSQTTGVSDPSSQWSSWTRAQKMAWLDSLRDALQSQLSVYFRPVWNDLDQTPDYLTAYSDAAIKPISG